MRGFSLIELLTVVFIITILIGILVPSLSAARNAAKKAKTNAEIKSISNSLELFRNDNERDYQQTNGYPPSSAGLHPPIVDAGGTEVFDRWLNEFPYAETPRPVLYGAQWLPALLMGVDQQGYVPLRSVPARWRAQPERWYDRTTEAIEEGQCGNLGLSRSVYLDQSVRTQTIDKLRGRPPADFGDRFANGADKYPVLLDGFDQPILYYAANKHGRPTNMVHGTRYREDRNYEGGPPYYFHVDNVGFTGWQDTPGWDFGGGGEHIITRTGEDADATNIMQPESDGGFYDSFARFILDRKIAQQISENQGDVGESTKLYPVNRDSYLLIAAGADGIYGSADDITNFPLTAE